MSSVRLSEIPRTSGFRTGLLFLVLFGASFLGLFGYTYWKTAIYLKQEVDANLHRQIDSRSAQSPEVRLQEMTRHAEQDREGRVPHTLFAPNGTVLAGALQAMPDAPAFDKPDEFRWDKPTGGHRPIRFIKHVLSDGNVLVVAQDVYDIHEFDELLVQALASGGALLLLVGLFGAVWLGNATRLRLNSLSAAIRRIVEGDLSRRLPIKGSLDDIDRIATVVNGMLDELERLMSEVKGVCDDIAHDLRTPLTRLIAGLERAQRRGLSEQEYAQMIDSALGDAKGLLSTFRALLRISEIEDSVRRSHFASVDLNRIAEDAVEFFEPLAEERGISLRLATGKGTAMISGDPQLLFDATCNLLDNAIKFSPDHSVITVEVVKANRGVTLTVADQGPGIPEAEREAVFRRLYRSESSRHTVGNGLGLSMVAAVARLHELSLEVSDAKPGCLITIKGRELDH
ncbi:ATP-binding protein [Pseudomonas sp. HS6-2]|jgi:signal transduction histidine kinase|uniref:sensor histidine kinase n=1 Tax=Pseudomonas sp. HS6-2 TaxID=3410986 RepID=UPI003BE64F3F